MPPPPPPAPGLLRVLTLPCRPWACSVRPWPQGSWVPSCASSVCLQRRWRLPTRVVSASPCLWLRKEASPCAQRSVGWLAARLSGRQRVGAREAGFTALTLCRRGSLCQSDAERRQAGAGGRREGQEGRRGGHELRLSYLLFFYGAGLLAVRVSRVCVRRGPHSSALPR